MRDLRSEYAEEIAAHRLYLELEAGDRVARWEELLRHSPEPALCEAVTRSFLASEGANVAVHEDPATGGPDFICIRNGLECHVEVTCVTIEKVTRISELSDEPQGACHYGLLTEAFRGELSGKTPQCSQLGGPCLVAICTLHRQGGVKCFSKHAAGDLLTGTSKITVEYDPELGEGIGDPYESTSLQDSAFIRFAKDSSGRVEFARNPISGVLLCASGYSSKRVTGIVHPNPNHVFDRNLLPNIKFAKLTDGCLETGALTVEWI